MMSIEELERSILAGARQELGPSATDRMRVQSGLVLTEAWWKPAPLRHGLRRSLRAAAHSWRGGVALGLAIGALLGYGAGVELARASRSAVPVAAPVESGARAAAPVPPRADVPADSLAGAVAAPEPGSVPSATDAAPATASAGVPARASESGAARRAAARDTGSTLAQELSLLQRARRALNRSDARLALGIVQSLDERFPNGVLMEERAATRILSLCQLQRTDEARAQAHRFLAAHPRSVYAERVRDSCAGGQ
jgi:hypothetical protein